MYCITHPVSRELSDHTTDPNSYNALMPLCSHMSPVQVGTSASFRTEVLNLFCLYCWLSLEELSRDIRSIIYISCQSRALMCHLCPGVRKWFSDWVKDLGLFPFLSKLHALKGTPSRFHTGKKVHKINKQLHSVRYKTIVCVCHRYRKRLRVNPISLSYPLNLPLTLSFAHSRESKGCPNSRFDRGVGLSGRGR